MSSYPPSKLQIRTILAAIRKERQQREDQEKLRAAGVFPADEARRPGAPLDEQRVRGDEKLCADHSLRLDD